jgi:hypothetical protein
MSEIDSTGAGSVIRLIQLKRGQSETELDGAGTASGEWSVEAAEEHRPKLAHTLAD